MNTKAQPLVISAVARRGNGGDGVVFMLVYQRACSTKWQTRAKRETTKQKKGAPNRNSELIWRAPELSKTPTPNTHTSILSCILALDFTCKKARTDDCTV